MRIKATLVTFTAIFVLANASASGAFGGIKLPGLQLSERGVPVVANSPVLNENFVFDGQCHQAAAGKVLNNDSLIDVVEVEPLFYDHCYESGSALAGQLKYVAFAATGLAVIVAQPALVLSTPGGCAYETSVLSGEFPIGTETAAYIVGETLGLRTRTSSASCPRSLRTEFTVGEWGRDEELLNTEPISIVLFSERRESPASARSANTCAKLLARIEDAAAAQGDAMEGRRALRRRGCNS